MKTRIRVVEYNNGRSEFICESNEINWRQWAKLFCSFFGTIPALLLLIFRSYSIMKLPIETIKDKLKNKDAIFDNIEDAKKFIDKALKDKVHKKCEAYQNSIKKQYKIKYP